MMNELTYHREGDYLLPDLLPPPSPNIGVWGSAENNISSKTMMASTLGCCSAES